MKYATVCSGIGAPEVAWNALDNLDAIATGVPYKPWGPPVFTSEIEPFPSAVLKHHYPDVTNHGDMTKYKEWPDYVGTEQLGLICGGTPCQSFSVAGLRKGMDDPRGNLTLTYLGILARYNPRWFIWENVPGVLSSASGGESDFGRFLSSLAELGYSCAYRVLDAQYFGVPQRRRRVFVVGHLGDDWRPPYAVLFEPESMRRDITPVSGRVLFCCDTGITSYDRSAKDNILIDTENNTARLLTPLEAERAYGFPDDFTLIPWKGKSPEDCPDGPRYKALGNSMAVPVVKWIGERIQMWEELKNPAT